MRAFALALVVLGALGVREASACEYVANEFDEECYGTLLGPTDWNRHGMVFGLLHRDEWWWGKGEHYYAVSEGTYVRIEVYGDRWPEQDDREWIAKRTAKAWAALPRVLRRATMPTQIIWESRAGNPIYYDQRNQARSRHAVSFTSDWVDAETRHFSDGFEEGLAHELCHAVDALDTRYSEGDWGYWSESGKWEAAMEDDEDSVSDYADTNTVEDFAETCAAWFSTSLDPDRRVLLAEKLPNRIRLLEELFDRFGGVSIEAVVE